MQTYEKDYGLYDFDKKKASKTRYMAKNFSTSQDYKKHDKNNMKHRNNILTK